MVRGSLPKMNWLCVAVSEDRGHKEVVRYFESGSGSTRHHTCHLRAFDFETSSSHLMRSSPASSPHASVSAPN